MFLRESPAGTLHTGSVRGFIKSSAIPVAPFFLFLRFFHEFLLDSVVLYRNPGDRARIWKIPGDSIQATVTVHSILSRI